jgi:hypothetical protein
MYVNVYNNTRKNEKTPELNISSIFTKNNKECTSETHEFLLGLIKILYYKNLCLNIFLSYNFIIILKFKNLKGSQN